jgi:hypothetical protein
VRVRNWLGDFVQCSVAIDARQGTSDRDNCCPATKPEFSFDLAAAGKSHGGELNRRGFSSETLEDFKVREE